MTSTPRLGYRLFTFHKKFEHLSVFGHLGYAFWVVTIAAGLIQFMLKVFLEGSQ